MELKVFRLKYKGFLWLTMLLTHVMTSQVNEKNHSEIKNGNPIIYDVGMADPHIKIYNNKAYLYATRDESKTAKKFTMPDWKIWSSNDLINWTLETTIDPTETYMGESKNCWAPDVAYRDGKYYFYFSNGNVDTGVMVGNSPIGPFIDPLNKPMLPKNLTPIKEYDPTVIIDDDGEAYVVFGHHISSNPDYYYMISKLNEDMISLAEEPKEIVFHGEMAEVLRANDKPNLHKRNGVYYLSAGSHYATSKNIYGPYTITGNSGNRNYGLTDRAHGNYFDWNNQSFHTWCHFHLGKQVARYRESYISYLHYKDNGEMVTDTDFLDAHFSMGVGQYDANWDKIESEWFMKSNKVEKKECSNGGFEIINKEHKGYLYFPNIYNLEDKNEIKFQLQSMGDVKIEIRENNAKGRLLGSVKVSNTNTTYQTVSCKIKNTKDVKNIFIQFKNKKKNTLHLDWFSFN